MGIMAYIPKNYARLEVGYREKALKLFLGLRTLLARVCLFKPA